jgi:hypothetical protein
MKLRKFLLSLYSLIEICISVKNWTFDRVVEMGHRVNLLIILVDHNKANFEYPYGNTFPKILSICHYMMAKNDNFYCVKGKTKIHK